MKNITLYLIICLCFVACRTSSTTKQIYYKPQSEAKTYSMEVPANYKIHYVIGNSYSYYFYKNSTCIFISNESGFWQKNNNKSKISDSLSSFAQSARYGDVAPIDTFIYQGVFLSSYWKEQFIYYLEPPFLKVDTIIDSTGRIFRQYWNPNAYQCLYVGYYNASKKELPLLEYCLSTLKMIENPKFDVDPNVSNLKRILKKGRKKESKNYEE